MEIELITTSAVEDPLDTSRTFGVFLNKVTTVIKMTHWYAKDHNAHVILGDLYDDLSELFDKLQEEIIGTVQSDNAIFPMFSDIHIVDLEDAQVFVGDHNSYVYYFDTVETVKNILTSLEFNNFVATVKSGIPNTREDIISRINKTNYLLSMVKTS
jgi:hypothetical protein